MPARLPFSSLLRSCSACARCSRPAKRRCYGTDTITANPTSSDIYDIAIIGGGPVGLSILTAVKTHPSTGHLRCTLVESQSLTKQRTWQLPSDKYSNRASSITPTNQAFLEAIGAWHNIDLRRIQPYDSMQVWDAGNDTVMDFDWAQEAARYNTTRRTVATMVENANLSRGLLRRIEELKVDGALLEETKVSSISNGTDDVQGLDLGSWPILHVQGTGGKQRQIAARLLIGADGINSPVRTYAGIQSFGYDYQRHGLVATLKTRPSEDDYKSFMSTISRQEDLDQVIDTFFSDDMPSASTNTSSSNPPNQSPPNKATAYQRFLPTLGGPIAILPLPDNHASLVWSTTPQHASYLKSLPLPAFVACVNAALRLSAVDTNYMLSISQPSSSTPPTSTSLSTLHESEFTWRKSHTSLQPGITYPDITAVQPGTIASFPLRHRQTSSYIAPHIALAGDAAHTIHPLAGQGLNLGLGDAKALAETIAYCVERGVDLGGEGTGVEVMLERYARPRYAKATAMAGGVDMLEKAFGAEERLGLGGGVFGSLVGRMRGWGMSVVSSVPGIREGIMRGAE